MLPQHVYSHQHQYPSADPPWQQQQLQHQQQNHSQHLQHHHNVQVAQAAAAAAAAAAAQQQHYNRIASNNNTNGVTGQAMGGDDRHLATPIQGFAATGQGFTGSPQESVSVEERRILEWIAQLLDPSTRESALLELSKKREQFPQLALILWHSFGMATRYYTLEQCRRLCAEANVNYIRRYGIFAAGDHFSLPASQPFSTDSCRFESRL